VWAAHVDSVRDRRVEVMFSGARMVTLIPIRNMNRALKFYTKVLGAKSGDRGRGAMRDFWASLKLGRSDVWLIAPPNREERNLAYQLFLVRNIKATVTQLKRKGVRFQRAERMGPETRIDGPIAYDPHGASAFFKDTEGNLLMVWQNFPAM
jgi:predicted enzyme related to lactoylglutathione lyase